MAAKRTISIGTATATEGTKAFGCLRVGELSDGSPIDMPVIIINGAQPGPILYVGAAIHANELTGVEVIRRIVSETDPRKLAGVIIAVPTQNPLAFRAKHPLTPYYNQKELTDMWSALPGDPKATLTEIMAHVLVKEAISKADYVIDIHTGFPAEECAVLVPPVEEGETQGKALELAKAVGLEAIEMFPSKLSDVTRVTHSIALDVELGESGRLDEKYVVMGVRGMRNIMKYLKMIEGTPELPEKQKIFKGRVQLRAGRGGWIVAKVKCLQEVKKGDLIASIYNLFTMEEVEQVRAPRDGTILRILTYPAVNMGDRIVAIGY